MVSWETTKEVVYAQALDANQTKSKNPSMNHAMARYGRFKGGWSVYNQTRLRPRDLACRYCFNYTRRFKMKLKKLFRNILVFWLATGAVGAFAQETCEERFISYTTINEDITVVGQDCRLQNVTVNGNVTVLGAEKFTTQNCNINGNITVRASKDVTINDTNAAGYVVTLTGNEQVDVTLVQAKGIAVTGNGLAYVIYNAAGTYDCKDNTRLIAEKNEGPNANQQCDSLGL